MSSSEETDSEGFPWFIVLAVVALAGVMFGLGRLAIINSERRDAEKTRGDLLQQSVNALRERADEAQRISEEDRKFFETLREFLTAQNAEERKVLLDELRNFKFTTATTSTTTKPRSTSTTSSSFVTPAPPPPSTTTTTRPPPSPPPSQPSPPSTIVCANTPIGHICK